LAIPEDRTWFRYSLYRSIDCTSRPAPSTAEAAAPFVRDSAVRGGRFLYVDRNTGTRMELDGVGLTVRDLSLGGKVGAGFVKTLSFTGDLGIAGFLAGNVSASTHGGETRITRLVSDWTLSGGVAEARDVAFATRKNRIALKVKLDIANGRFAGVTVASLDEKGCAKLRQGINGPFKDSTLDKVSTRQSAAAPILGLFAETKSLLTRGACEPFYTGAVAHPK